MQITIDTTGEMENQLIKDGELIRNLEARDYEFQVEFTPEYNETIWQFTLIDQPGDLEINPLTGLITGNLKSLEYNGEEPLEEPQYPEYDFRNQKETRPPNADYKYDFKIVVQGMEDKGSGTIVPFTDNSDVSITITKDNTINQLINQQKYFDGTPDREPCTCKYQKIQSESQCILIGGVWDNQRNECSIQIPQTQAQCQAIGGLWENNACNIQMIDNQTQCEQAGYKWEKNYFIFCEREEKKYCEIPNVTQSECQIEGGTWKAGYCLDPSYSTKQECELNNKVWIPDYCESNETKESCELNGNEWVNNTLISNCQKIETFQDAIQVPGLYDDETVEIQKNILGI